MQINLISFLWISPCLTLVFSDLRFLAFKRLRQHAPGHLASTEVCFDQSIIQCLSTTIDKLFSEKPVHYFFRIDNIAGLGDIIRFQLKSTVNQSKTNMKRKQLKDPLQEVQKMFGSPITTRSANSGELAKNCPKKKTDKVIVVADYENQDGYIYEYCNGQWSNITTTQFKDVTDIELNICSLKSIVTLSTYLGIYNVPLFKRGKKLKLTSTFALVAVKYDRHNRKLFLMTRVFIKMVRCANINQGRWITKVQNPILLEVAPSAQRVFWISEVYSASYRLNSVSYRGGKTVFFSLMNTGLVLGFGVSSYGSEAMICGKKSSYHLSLGSGYPSKLRIHNCIDCFYEIELPYLLTQDGLGNTDTDTTATPITPDRSSMKATTPDRTTSEQCTDPDKQECKKEAGKKSVCAAKENGGNIVAAAPGLLLSLLLAVIYL